MNSLKFAISVGALALASGLSAQDQTAQANPQIDYDGFAALTAEVASYRETRLLKREAFFDLAKRSDVLLLDTRSASDFRMGHIEGAVNLPFSEFTDDKLRSVIGDNPDRVILIYCNNNFSDNIAPLVSKRAPLALNIPTFINLYGYGYKNVWELADVMSVNDVDWNGMQLDQARPLIAQ